jgi:hypothetical protein
VSALRLHARVHVVAVLLLLTFSSFPPLIQGSTQPVAAGSEALARYTVEITDAARALL